MELKDRILAWSATGVALAVFLWLWGEAPWVALWPIFSATTALIAAMVVWADLVPGNPRDGWWSLGAGAVILGELVLEYLLLPVEAWPGQLMAWSGLVLAAAVAARLNPAPGWQTGLRVGLGTAVVAVIGQSIVFGVYLGQPVQATVLEAQGAMERFEATPSSDFLTWAVSTHWSDKAVLLVLGAVLGLAAGWFGGWLRPRTRR